MHFVKAPGGDVGWCDAGGNPCSCLCLPHSPYEEVFSPLSPPPLLPRPPSGVATPEREREREEEGLLPTSSPTVGRCVRRRRRRCQKMKSEIGVFCDGDGGEGKKKKTKSRFLT